MISLRHLSQVTTQDAPDFQGFEGEGGWVLPNAQRQTRKSSSDETFSIWRCLWGGSCRVFS